MFENKPGRYLTFEQNGSWHQIFADQMSDKAKFNARPHPGSRRQRRIIKLDQGE